jgi:hypothetical protein
MPSWGVVSPRATIVPVSLTPAPPPKARRASTPGSPRAQLHGGRTPVATTASHSRPVTARRRSKWWMAMSWRSGCGIASRQASVVGRTMAWRNSWLAWATRPTRPRATARRRAIVWGRHRQLWSTITTSSWRRRAARITSAASATVMASGFSVSTSRPRSRAATMAAR